MKSLLISGKEGYSEFWFSWNTKLLPKNETWLKFCTNNKISKGKITWKVKFYGGWGEEGLSREYSNICEKLVKIHLQDFNCNPEGLGRLHWTARGDNHVGKLYFPTKCRKFPTICRKDWLSPRDSLNPWNKIYLKINATCNIFQNKCGTDKIHGTSFINIVFGSHAFDHLKNFFAASFFRHQNFQCRFLSSQNERKCYKKVNYFAAFVSTWLRWLQQCRFTEGFNQETWWISELPSSRKIDFE